MTFLKRSVSFVVVFMVCFSMFIGFSVPVSAASVFYPFEVNGVSGYMIPDAVSEYPVHTVFTFSGSVYLVSCSSSDVKLGLYDSYTSSYPIHNYQFMVLEHSSDYTLSCFKLFSDGTSSVASIPSSDRSSHFTFYYSTIDIYLSSSIYFHAKEFPSPTYSLSISNSTDSPVINDSKSRFSSLEVTFSCAIVTYEDGTEFEYIYSGDMAFNGFALADDGPVVYAVGNTYDLSDVDGLSLFVKTRNRTWATFFPDLAAIAGSFMVQVRNVANSISSNPLLLLCSGFLFLGGCIGIFVRLSSRN